MSKTLSKTVRTSGPKKTSLPGWDLTDLYQGIDDKQIDKGTLVPANKNVVLSVLQELDNVQKFGEDSTVVSGFKSFIESLPPQIKFGEIVTKDKQTDLLNFDIEKFSNADEESIEIFKQAKALAEKENISFKDALLKLNK